MSLITKKFVPGAVVGNHWLSNFNFSYFSLARAFATQDTATVTTTSFMRVMSPKESLSLTIAKVISYLQWRHWCAILSPHTLQIFCETEKFCRKKMLCHSGTKTRSKSKSAEFFSVYDWSALPFGGFLQCVYSNYFNNFYERFVALCNNSNQWKKQCLSQNFHLKAFEIEIWYFWMNIYILIFKLMLKFLY